MASGLSRTVRPVSCKCVHFVSSRLDDAIVGLSVNIIIIIIIIIKVFIYRPINRD